MKNISQMLQEYRDSNNEWRKTFDAMKEAVALLDPDGRILRCNRAMSEFLRLPFASIIGHLCGSFCICTGESRERCPITRCRQTRKRESSTYNCEGRWIEITADPILDESGAIKGFVHILEDITDRNNLELELRKSEEKFRSLFDLANDSFFIVDMKGNIIDANRTAYDRLGYSRDELLGKCVSELDPPEFAEKVPERMAQIGRNGHAVFESAHTAKNGTVIPVEISARVIDYAGQNMVLSVIRDITERKEAESRLRQSEERYRLLFQKTPIGVFQYDTSLRITDCNERFIEILGSSRNNIINLDMNTLRDRRVLSAIKDVLRGEEGLYEGRYLATTSTAEVIVSMRTSPMCDASNRVIGGICIVEDISDKVAMEQRVVEQQRFSESLIQNSAVATFVLDSDHTVLIWNRACEEMTGVKTSEIVGTKKQWRAFYDHERPVLADLVLDGYSERISEHYDVFSPSLYAPDGLHAEGWYRMYSRPCYLAFDASPIRDSSGNIISVIETLQDLTIHKQTEDVIRRSEEKYRKVVENAFDMIQSIAPDGSILYVNPAWLSIMGYTREELSDKNIFEIIDHSCIDKCSSVFSSLKSGIPVENFETQFRAKDGRVIDIEGSASVNVVDGRVESMQCMLRDVTERKKFEEQIFRNQQDWEYTFNSITDMVTVHDKDYNIIMANRAAEKLLNLPVFEKMKERKCYSYYHGTDHAPSGCPSCSCLKSGLSESFELFEPHLNMFVEIRAIPRYDSSGNLIGLIHVVRDITERKKSEEERERLNREKEMLHEQLLQSQKMEAVGTLAGGIAHDFNNILNVIIGYSGMLENMNDIKGKAREFLKEIINASNRAAYLTRGLLAFSRKQHLELKPADLNAIIKSITGMLHRIIGEDIRMNLKLEEEGLVIVCDAAQIEQIIVNLAANARDAMPKGGMITLETGTMDIDESFCQHKGFGSPGRYAVMHLADTGIGMDEETQYRIFEPFFTTKQAGKGTGLGLSIIYGIVTQHNGFLECQSLPGRGTTFSVYLPMAVKAVKGEEEQEPIDKAGRGRGELILLGEDDDSGRRLIKIVLEHQGYKVIEASNGMEVLEKYVERPDDISLLLLDVIMPDMNGYDALELVRERFPEAKAILMSGYTADILEQRGISHLAAPLLKKRVSPHDLLNIVRDVLDEKTGVAD